MGGDSLPVSLWMVASTMTLKRELPSSVLELRRLLVGELQRAPEKYYLRPSKELRQELKLMQYEGQLMCVEVLLAFGHMFDCIVLVHYGGRIPVVYKPFSYNALLVRQHVHLQCLRCLL